MSHSVQFWFKFMSKKHFKNQTVKISKLFLIVSGSFPCSSLTWLRIVDCLCSSTRWCIGVDSWSKHSLHRTDHTCNTEKQRFIDSHLGLLFILFEFSFDVLACVNRLDNGINLSLEAFVKFWRSLNGRTILMPASWSSDTCCLEHTFSVTFISITCPMVFSMRVSG